MIYVINCNSWQKEVNTLWLLHLQHSKTEQTYSKQQMYNWTSYCNATVFFFFCI